MYAGAALLAGLLFGALLGGLGAWLASYIRAGLWATAGVLGIVFGVLELLRGKAALLERDCETSQRWLHQGPLRWAAKNGFMLGLGFTTRIGYCLWYWVPICAFLSGSISAGAAVYAVYSFTRCIVPMVALVGAVSGRWNLKPHKWLAFNKPTAHYVSGLLTLAAGVWAIWQS
jgi:hypothetical protein